LIFHSTPHAVDVLLDFEPLPGDEGFSAQNDSIKIAWLAAVTPILAQATLIVPPNARPVFGGRSGEHTPHLSTLLDEMQKVAHTESPDVVW
jgi:ring-1,2-phenylacetyl-CoA epoxidase subunit PaaC